MLENDVLEYLKTIDITLLSLNEIIQTLQNRFQQNFDDRREEIEEALVSMNFEELSDGEDPDLELAKQLQDEERRQSTRAPSRKRSRTTSDKTKPKKTTSKNGLFHRPVLVSSELADILGVQKCSRPEVVKLLWKYIKENNLQDPKDRRFILCDEKLSKIFKKKRVSSFGMNRDISRHLDIDGDVSEENKRPETESKSSSFNFPGKVVSLPTHWLDLGFEKEAMTYHDLQIEILKRLRHFRNKNDPDVIDSTDQDDVISELMSPCESTECRTTDILKNLRAKFKAQIEE